MKTKTNLLLALMLISFAPMLQAQDFWERIEIPDSVTIRCMVLNQQGHIFVGTGYHGETGGVYRSMDDGQSWECVYFLDRFSIFSIEINEQGYIYAGKNGFDALIYSKNNGEDWHPLYPPLGDNLLEILCVGGDTIFISQWTSGPFIAYSYNGGQDWDSVYLENHQIARVRDIALADNGCLYAGVHGYSSGEGGLYKSEDWGKSWNYIGLVNHQVCAVAVNSNNEVFTGDWWTMNHNVQTPGLYALYEGGDSLELILESVQVTDIAIAENDHIYIAANYWNLVSYDNGYSFEVLSKPSQLIGATELEIASNGHIYGFGGNSVVKSIDPLITALPVIKQTGKDHLLKLYPNPSSKYLNILFEGKTSTGPIYVGITNSEGKKVFERKSVSEEKLQIDIGHLPVGLYFARVRTNKELLCRKFIKR